MLSEKEVSKCKDSKRNEHHYNTLSSYLYRYKIHSKRSMQQASRSTTETYGVVGVPTVYLPYSEPIYGPL